MRLVVLVLAMSLATACGEPQSGVLSASTSSPAPVATPTPDIALRLMDRVTKMTAIVRRVDRITAAQEKWGDILSRRGVRDSGADPNEDVWVIAVVGEVAPSFGPSVSGASPCGVFVYDQAENVKSGSYGSLAACASYFSDSLVPPSAPVACPPEPQGYAYDGHSPTTSGPVRLTISRDDNWRQPTIAPGAFLYEVPPGSDGYYETYCRADHVVPTANDTFEARMLLGLGSPKVAGLPGQAQIWLKDLHAVDAVADGDAVRVVVEPRKGFEIASFDWRSIAPQTANYIRIDYVDRSGHQVIPFRIANGP